MYQVDPSLQEKALTIATELSEDLQGVTYQVSTQKNTLPKGIAYTCLDICIGTVKTCCWSWVISVVYYIFYLLMLVYYTSFVWVAVVLHLIPRLKIINLCFDVCNFISVQRLKNLD